MTMEMQMEKNDEEDKSLEAEVEFSWKRVFERGVQNMKDDIDPVYKGAKMGIYALHGIPTWAREARDGKLSTDSVGWSVVAGLFVGGSCTAAYVMGGVLFPPILAVPVVAQGISYTREAFRRARKTEMENVIMTKVQRSLNEQGENEYDLSCQKMIKELAGKLYAHREEDTQTQVKEALYRIESFNEDIQTVEKATDLNSVDKHQQIKKLRTIISEIEKSIEQGNKSLEEYKIESVLEAREGLVYVARDVFNGLFADNKLGKGQDYEMSSTKLEVGPKKRKRDYEREMCFDYSPRLDEQSIVAQLVSETVKKKGGTANVELFGQLTAIYSSKQNEETHYNVKPNGLWRVKNPSS
ncbi:MAG: hypothetical protein AABW48_01360 [Nanoarchaeota archaeon]